MWERDGWALILGVLLAIGAKRAWGARAGARQMQYKPGSPALARLLRSAAAAARVPESWATNDDIHYIIRVESGGWVGIPNYTYGRRQDQRFPGDISSPTRLELWPQVHAELRAGVKGAISTATGLGQLILANVTAYYPEGAEGIGDAWNEAVGYLAYVRSRYGSPAEAARVRRSEGHY